MKILLSDDSSIETSNNLIINYGDGETCKYYSSKNESIYINLDKIKSFQILNEACEGGVNNG